LGERKSIEETLAFSPPAGSRLLPFENNDDCKHDIQGSRKVILVFAACILADCVPPRL